ncbi:MAG TPA: HD domain-containing protein [Candidatus Paceibacterota bacterium]|nr:HD domain-containing protein [Candidatus Paceibacterota bacterium]
MKPDPSILKVSDAEIMAIAVQLHSAYQFKRTLRYGTTRDFSVQSESDAEHVFGLVYLKEYFLPLEDSLKELDGEKIARLILFHDFPEMKYGDRPYHLKTKEDEARERAAAPEVFAALPPSMHKLGLDSWKEYEERKSLEAQFVYALDKVEPLFELMDPVNEQCHIRLHQTYESHIGKKLKATEIFPVMRRFVEVISADKKRRDVFWKE